MNEDQIDLQIIAQGYNHATKKLVKIENIVQQIYNCSKDQAIIGCGTAEFEGDAIFSSSSSHGIIFSQDEFGISIEHIAPLDNRLKLRVSHQYLEFDKSSNWPRFHVKIDDDNSTTIGTGSVIPYYKVKKVKDERKAFRKRLLEATGLIIDKKFKEYFSLYKVIDVQDNEPVATHILSTSRNVEVHTETKKYLSKDDIKSICLEIFMKGYHPHVEIGEKIASIFKNRILSLTFYSHEAHGILDYINTVRKYV